ncbi:response regulator [Inhella sp.]|uniref:response regulator n=1 Tax=Inhella sp. TaxID=1921806 RepID=UPI0035ADFFB6
MNRSSLRYLLVEPQFVLRRTIVTVARDYAGLQLDECSSIDRARPQLSTTAFAGLVLDFQDSTAAFELLGALRRGDFVSPSDIPVIVLAAELRPDDANRLKALAVQHVLGKPFKIGHLLSCLGVHTGA